MSSQEMCRLCGDAPAAWYRIPPFSDMEAVQTTPVTADSAPYELCEECFQAEVPQEERPLWQKVY